MLDEVKLGLSSKFPVILNLPSKTSPMAQELSKEISSKEAGVDWVEGELERTFEAPFSSEQIMGSRTFASREPC